MPKLVKNYYYGKNGEQKVNCYLIHIPKKVVLEANIKENDNILVYAEEDKIVIKKG